MAFLPDDPSLTLPNIPLEFGFEDEPDVRQGAIVLSGEDLQRFSFRFQSALERSMQKMHIIHENARRDRKTYQTIPKEPAYEGGPDATASVSSDRTDGLIAYLTSSIEKRPFISFTAEGVGKQAEVATQVAPLYEAYMEREINGSGAREILASFIPKELAEVGTAIVKLGMAERNGEMFVQPAELIRLENFFVDRISTSNLRDVFCAYRYRERRYNLDAQAERGLLDREAVDSLTGWSSGGTAHNEEEKEVQFDQTSIFEDENTLHELFVGYMHFRPKGENEAKLYECVWHRGASTVLALRDNPVGEAFDESPLQLVRIGKESNALFGRGIPRRLETEQKIADNAVNTHLARNDISAAPPVQYNINNPIAAALAENGRLQPNMWIPTYGPPDKGDIAPVIIPNPGLALQDYGLAQEMASRRTYTDQALGQTTTTRKTLGQFRVEMQKGTIKLNVDLTDLAYDMAELAMKMWAMITEYKIKAEGIVTIGQSGKALAYDEISAREWQGRLVHDGLIMLQQGQASIEDVIELDVMAQAMMTDGIIPSARRTDITPSLTGTSVFTDVLAELNTELEILPVILNLIDAARQDSYINYIGRQIITKAGFKDVARRWPDDPAQLMEAEARQQALMPLNELLRSRSTV